MERGDDVLVALSQSLSHGDEDIAARTVERYQKFALGSCTGGGILKVDSVP